MAVDLHATMSRLAVDRPVFHSEADFQHALAWRLREEHPEYRIRLEYRAPQQPQRGYVDIWLAGNGEEVGIELKYKTRGLSTTVDGEVFDLLNQGAQDIARYDTLKDIQRLERVVEVVPGSKGFVLLLTNDQLYWKAPRRATSVDSSFHLHEGRTLAGELAWGELASAGTRKGREAALRFAKSYTLNWRSYSRVPALGNAVFRYALFGISP